MAIELRVEKTIHPFIQPFVHLFPTHLPSTFLTQTLSVEGQLGCVHLHVAEWQ